MKFFYSVVTSLTAIFSLVASQHDSPCEYKHITQQTDHFGQHDGVFQQRFSIFTEYFEPGGPILFFQGEETPILDCANDTILYEWAKELKGMAVSLEHRYFGPSKPFGDQSNTVENLQYLTLDNVMADAVAFIEQIRSNITDSKDSKVIVASGSYGGYLTAAFVLNRPDDFYGAIASAGSVMGWGNGSDPESYNWWFWVNQVYQDRSIAAANNIKNAFETLDSRLAANDTASLQEELNLCTPVEPGNKTHIESLHLVLPQVYSMAAEFNYPYASPGRTPLALPLEHAVKFALNTSDPIQILAKTNWMWYEPLGLECIDFANATFLAVAVPIIEREYFQYVTCSYVPLHASAYVSNTTIFPARGVADPTARCVANYGKLPLTKEEVETRYNFAPSKLAESKRIIWSKGEYDPVSGIEPASLPLSADIMRSRTLEAADVAHREDLFASHPDDREGVKLLRKKELEIIRGWLGL